MEPYRGIGNQFHQEIPDDVGEVHVSADEAEAHTVEDTVGGNVAWLKFKLAFQQAAMMVPGAKTKGPKNRKQLRDLLRHDPTLRDVRKLVFGNWRTR